MVAIVNDTIIICKPCRHAHPVNKVCKILVDIAIPQYYCTYNDETLLPASCGEEDYISISEGVGQAAFPWSCGTHDTN